MKPGTRRISIIVLVVLATSISTTAPALAAVLDQVQNKVQAIKTDTATIKTRTATMVSSARTQLEQTVDIRAALEPLFVLGPRLQQLGIDPTELFDLVPAEEIRAAIDDMKQRRDEAQDRLNDPDLEPFRADFIGVIRAMDSISGEPTEIGSSILEDLIARAPQPLLALMKMGMDPVFDELKTAVLSASANMQQLNSLGVFDLQYTLQDAALTNDERCSALESIRPGIFAIHLTQFWLTDASERLQLAMNTIPDNKKAELGIHGYFHIPIWVGKAFKKNVERRQIIIESLNAKLGHTVDLLSSVRSHDLCPRFD